MTQYISKFALVAEIEKRKKEAESNCGGFKSMREHECDNCIVGQYEEMEEILDTLEVIDPYEQYVQHDSIKSGIQAHAETYSLNIESVLFPLLTKEQQALWRKEIEQACISGGEVGVELARDQRYKENLEVKEVDLEKEIKDYFDSQPIITRSKGFNYRLIPSSKNIAKHFFELGLKAQSDKELVEEESVPQHSYYETIYHVGKEPRWKVGDNLAYYQFYSDHEGEYDFGKVIKVEFNEEYEDWYYTFEDSDRYSEEELIREETYRIK